MLSPLEKVGLADSVAVVWQMIINCLQCTQDVFAMVTARRNGTLTHTRNIMMMMKKIQGQSA